MPYKDPDKQRTFQRERTARCRAAFFADKQCVDCASTERLELDHVDKTTKLCHKIWSWALDRREAEIAKCVVRCRACHIERHAAEKRQDHGLGAYKRGCRCGYCRAAKAAKERRWREKRRRDQGGARDRTGVSAFAGPRVSHSATPPEQPTLFDLEEVA